MNLKKIMNKFTEGFDMQNTNWEKITIYLVAWIGFLVIVSYILDLKERVSKVETEIEHLLDEKTMKQFSFH